MSDHADGTGTIAPTEALKIDEPRLAEYLRGLLTAAPGPLRLPRFSPGQSNPPYFAAFAAAQYVPRKPPPVEPLPPAPAFHPSPPPPNTPPAQ